ncbi:E3 ubiquitin-protein ligase SH3RF1-like, partial [Acanthaster planci]|uniref:E3 ubiquitin-protein ligase SH3RF1-like n=1 Tax=Acanthaster planci TaxID=133434 RepID=A0A8B7YYW0_ACAPL
MEPGSKVRAIFDFIANAPDELPLHHGDLILVEQKVDHNWLIGSCNGVLGTFPANFVELVVDDALLDRFAKGQKVIAVETFSTGADGDLSFKKGDIVEITKQIDENWLEGRLGNNTGIFPVTYVSEHNTQHVSTPGDILRARALKDNHGQLQDELSFKKNDVITIVEKIDEDWYKGMLDDKTGTLPAVKVEILNPGDAAPPATTTSPDVGKDGVDYNVVNERLRSAMQVGKSATPACAKTGNDQNGEPWAKALFPFSAEHPGEISLMDGDRVILRRRIDDNWLEGEIGGKVGIFPSNYVQIQLDIPEGYAPPSKPTNGASSNHKPQSLPVPSGSANNNNLKAGAVKWKGKRGKVLFDFAAVTDQDLGVKQGEIVTIIDKVDADWFEARHPSGRTGFLPVNYVKVLEKPKTPSFKRPAPLPPKPSPTSATQNGSAAPGTNSINADLLDIFSMPPETTGKQESKSKPPLPPKSAKVLSADKPKAPSAVDDLLCFDPLGDNAGDTSPHILPDIQPLKSQTQSDQVGFKLGGGAYRPVSFAGKQSPPESTTPKKSSTGNPFSSVEPTTEAPVPQGQSLLDMSPIDKPSTSVLAPVSAPLSPPPDVSQPSPSKPPLQKKPSFDLLTAKPFSAVTAAHIHSVPRPGSQGSSGSPTSPRSPKSRPGLLTPTQVNQELDRALCEGEAPAKSPSAEPSKFNPFSATDSVEDASEPLPPVPPRQPSPNPFSAGDQLSSSDTCIPPPLPPRQPSPNPFRAESPPLAPPPSEPPPPVITASLPQTAQHFTPTPAPKPQLPPPRSTSNPPFQNPPSAQWVNLMRDDSITSEFSDDYLMQNINFSIRPSNADFQAPTAFKLPPPPTKSKVKASTVESPRSRRKFNPKSAVPRPRGRSLDREGGSSPHPEDFELPPDHTTPANREKFQQDLQNFQASIQQMFDPSKFEDNGEDDFSGMPLRDAPPPPDAVAITTDQTASLLDEVFDGITSDVPTSASITHTSDYSAPVADILGLGFDPPATGNATAAVSKVKPGRTPPGRPKEPAPKKKTMPPRPAPPKFGPGHRSAEDELLAKLRPEGSNQLDTETQETVKALQCSISELKDTIAVQQEQKKIYEQMLQTASAEEIPDMEQQLTDCIGTIENLQTELRSLE